MNTSSKCLAAVVLGLATLSVVGAMTASGDARAQEETTPKKNPLELSMRSKLDAASKVLEGLAIEDKELVHDGATVLTELSKVEKWQILKSSEYREHTQSFRSAVKRLDEAAQKGEFAAAQLEWLDVSKRCFDCHNEIRESRVTK
ncbi:MAG: hypothetical protein ACK58L_11350 [Planctomycetota bacterium]